MLKVKKIFIALLILVAVPCFANDLTQFTSVLNTDFAMFGYGGMRGLGSGSITVSGISGSVTQAFLYWHGPTNSAIATVNADVTFNGTSITGTHIGESDNNCWSFTNSRAYSADVTSLVTGNDTYTLANFTKADADINGVSLLIFYDDGDANNNRDIVILHGNDSNINNLNDAPGMNATLNGIEYNSGTATMHLIVSDGQSFPDEGIYLNSVELLPNAALNFQGDSLPNGPGLFNGGMWDHRALDISSVLTPGINNLILTSGPYYNDCLSLIAVIYDMPAQSSPFTPIPTMNEWGMIFMSLMLAGSALWILRRRQIT